MNRSFVRFARHAAWVSLVAACAGVVACSNSSNPPADAFFASTMGPGPGDACPFPTEVNPWLLVGTATGGNPTTVQDQGSTGSGTASISCTVHPQGSGFDINLSIQVAGPMGGSVVITSPSGAGAVTQDHGATGVTATFYSAQNLGPYEDQGCTIAFTYEGKPVNQSPAVAGGRIWGHLLCPHALKAGGATMTGMDGGVTTQSCEAVADFLFEQCSQ